MFIRPLAIAIGLLVLVGGTSAKAEPGPVGRWLMDTPVSLWDFGLREMQEMVWAWKGKNLLGNTSSRLVYYNWDENRIIISIFNQKAPFSRNECKLGLRAIRAAGAVENGKASKYIGHSAYANSFSRGFTTKSEPKDYLKKIDQIIQVKFTMKGGSCEGRLISTEVLYREN